jgi:hypothetical protein
MKSQKSNGLPNQLHLRKIPFAKKIAAQKVYSSAFSASNFG